MSNQENVKDALRMFSERCSYPNIRSISAGILKRMEHSPPDQDFRGEILDMMNLSICQSLAEMDVLRNQIRERSGQ